MDSSDEEEYGIELGYGFHHMQDMARLMLMQQMISAQSWPDRFHHVESSTFIEGWSTRPSHHEDDEAKPTCSAVSVKVATLFNMPNHAFTDLAIISKGNRKIYAHQVIVASWSNPLKQHILSERKKWGCAMTVDGKTLDIILEADDESLSSVEDFIRYMYTESIDLSLQTVWHHIILATKYDVVPLLVVCTQFIYKQVAVLPIRPYLLTFMDQAVNYAFTKTVVQITMLRIQSELFFEDAEVVSSFDVDFLCDVLRSSNVVADSEYAIFQKLKPKMDALKQAGKTRELHRLLALLRLTQMKASELRELYSGEYMDEMRSAFPGKLESALWTRALFSEQSFDEVPISVERPRLYLEIPVPYMVQHIRNPYYNEAENLYEGKSMEFEQRKFHELRFKIKNGEQVAEDSTYVRRHVHLESCNIPVYQTKAGEHNVTRHIEECRLEIPLGKFDFVTINYRLPILLITFKLILVFNIESQTGTKRRVIAHIGTHCTKLGEKFSIFPLPISEDCSISITNAVCYALQKEDVKRMNWNEALEFNHVDKLPASPFKWTLVRTKHVKGELW
ncbi:uncharacterized protein [Apostichopus japonicus]|uniref:uncharacterized protein n=1 Tax=Stichopus japonicus TaxID=307972 RepID=UPI003AB15C67